MESLAIDIIFVGVCVFYAGVALIPIAVVYSLFKY